MNNNVWVLTKSGNWYKTNFQKDIREVTRIITHVENAFVPCVDNMGRETYLNTSEVECVTDFKEFSNETTRGEKGFGSTGY